MFAVGSGLEEDPFVIDDEVPQRSPCSLCAKESYTGPVQTGQRCMPHGQRPGSSPSEDSNVLQRRFKIWRRQATPSERSLMGETLYHEFNGSRAVRKRRAWAIDFINDELLSASRDVSLRLESLVPIPIPPDQVQEPCLGTLFGGLSNPWTRCLNVAFGCNPQPQSLDVTSKHSLQTQSLDMVPKYGFWT